MSHFDDATKRTEHLRVPLAMTVEAAQEAIRAAYDREIGRDQHRQIIAGYDVHVDHKKPFQQVSMTISCTDWEKQIPYDYEEMRISARVDGYREFQFGVPPQVGWSETKCVRLPCARMEGREVPSYYRVGAFRELGERIGDICFPAKPPSRFGDR